MLFEDEKSDHPKVWSLARIESPKDLVFPTEEQEIDTSDPPK